MHAPTSHLPIFLVVPACDGREGFQLGNYRDHPYVASRQYGRVAVLYQGRQRGLREGVPDLAESHQVC